MAVGINDITNRWEFENVLTDSVGGLTLTNNGAVFETSNPMFGVASIRTDGLNDNLTQASATLNPDSGSFSVELWIDPDNITTSYVISKGSRNADEEGWSLIIFSTFVRMIFNASDDISERSIMEKTFTPPTTKQQYILVVDRDNDIVRGYYNGSNDFTPRSGFSSDITGWGAISTSNPLILGSGSLNDFYFDGLADKIRVYKGYAITDADAVTLYNGGNGFDFETNETTVGIATAVDGGNHNINVSMPYTDDDNTDSTYTVDYKLSSDASYTNWVTGANNTPSPFLTTITGLLGAETYDVRVTYIDPDGITGTNPQTITDISIEALPNKVIPIIVKSEFVYTVVRNDSVGKVIKRIRVDKVIK